MADDRFSGPFQALRDAWLRGCAIIPLFGGGLSVGAGIPLSPQLVDYLVKVYWYSRLRDFKDPHEYIVQCGWPSRHQLNADLRADRTIGTDPRSASDWEDALMVRRKEAVARAFETRVRRLLTSELKEDHRFRSKLKALFGDAGSRQVAQSQAGDPTQADWVSLLHFVAGSDQHLVDAFFTRLVRNRIPHGAHQFVAYLTKLLNWNLILTTNFDNLVEVALRTEGLSPAVYELVRDEMPDPHLVRSHLSVLKLHGGAFNLRAGFDLRQPLSAQQRKIFLEYLPKGAVMFVLGYGGGDRRVMATLEAATSKLSQLIWVHRGPKAPDTLKALSARENVKTFSYEDAALFLQELYQRSNLSYPASRSHYRLLHSVPEVQSQPPATIIQPGLIQPRAGERLIILRCPEDGQYLRQTMIQACRESKFFGYHQLWFNLYEFSSLQSFLSVLLEELRRLDRSLPPLMLKPAVDSDRWYRWMAEALRRNRYLLAIDGVRAFDNTHPALTSTDLEGSVGLDVLLRRLVDHAPSFGESIVVISGLLPNAPDYGGGPHVRTKSLPPAEKQTAQTSKQRAETLWKNANSWERAVLAVASAFRRPRGLVGLVRLAATRLKHSAPEAWPDVGDLTEEGPAERAFGERAKQYLVLERVVEGLVGRALIRQEGGSYSMDPFLRNDLYELCVDAHEAAKLHHDIADYYRVMVYEQSKDFKAYCEYVFHRTASAIADRGADRIAWFTRSLDRERDYVIGRGHASSLLDILDGVDSRLEALGPNEPRVRQLQNTLGKMRRLVAGSVADYNTSIRLLRERTEVCLVAAGAAKPGPAEPDARAGFWLSGLARAAQFVPTSRDQLLWLLEIVDLLIELAAAVTAVQVVADIDETEVAKHTLRVCATELTEQGDHLLGDDEVGARIEEERRLQRAGALAGLMDLELRGINPWEIRSTKTTRNSVDRYQIVKNHYKTAIELLRDARQNGRWSRLQTLLRCLAARGALLAGSFSQANHELNRAHAFAAQPHGQHDYLSLGVYWLHRAEYCMLHVMAATAMTSGGVRSLLDSGTAALAQADQCLLTGRRDVAWWGRLYILKARLQVLILRTQVPTPSVAIAGDYRQRLGTSAIEHTILAGLSAVAGGLANIHEHRQRETLLDEIWDELLVEAASAASRCTGGLYVDGKMFALLWEELNDRAGLNAYWRERTLRRNGMTLQIEISANQGPVGSSAIDVNSAGIGVCADENTLQKNDPVTVSINGVAVSGLVRYAERGRVGVAFQRSSFETRLLLACVLEKLPLMPPRDRRNRSAGLATGV